MVVVVVIILIHKSSQVNVIGVWGGVVLKSVKEILAKWGQIGIALISEFDHMDPKPVVVVFGWMF